MLMEIEKIDMLLELVTEDVHERVCLYLIRQVCVPRPFTTLICFVRENFRHQCLPYISCWWIPIIITFHLKKLWIMRMCISLVPRPSSHTFSL